MANPEHLDILKQGVEVWNTWREQNGEVMVDLREADLSEANLQKAYLGGANLQKVDLDRANLQGAILFWTNLQEADLGAVNLQGANLWKANLLGVNLAGTNHLTQAQLNQACVDEQTKLPEGLTRPKPCPEEELSKK